MTREHVARIAGILALGIAVVALILVLFTGGSSYVVHADFYDAGQLVRGDLVTVAGHHVGSVGSISLSKNGLADVELDISDTSITPIHEGTLASIGQLSLTGVANRFVGLTLSGAGPQVQNGGTLPVTQTRGIVDLDTVLDALTPHVRKGIQRILRSGAYLVRQPTASQFNQVVHYLNPALSQTSQFGSEVVADQFALDRLLSSSSQVARTLATRNADLGGAVTNTASVLREVAAERNALSDIIVRAPGVLQQSTGVLRDVNYSLRFLNPVLVDLRPVAPRLAELLRIVVPTARNALPLISGVQALVPSAKASLLALPPVVRKATPAIKSLTAGVKDIIPILAGLRPYMPDVVAGFFNGVGGATGGSYDANGHYLKSVLTVQANGTGTLSGLLGLLGGLLGKAKLPVLGGGRTRLLAPCPGGGNPPAADRSNPWNSPDILRKTGNLCNPANNQK
jgi:phospholipid/cholesterol/gamma-HCH transport system substrate-binding protein